MGIVDDLLANPGLYIGTDTVIGTDLVGVARITVARCPAAPVSASTTRSSTPRPDPCGATPSTRWSDRPTTAPR